MPLLTPPPAAPQRGDTTTFKERVDAFLAWLVNFVAELLALVGNLNVLAAGGAYAIPYTFRSTPYYNGGGGVLAWRDASSNPSSASAAAQLLVDVQSLEGSDVAALLSSTVISNGSTIKGHIRLQKVADPAAWVLFAVTSYTQASGVLYGNFGVSFVGSSSSTPFADTDGVILSFQRTGDKGDQGASGFSNMVVIRTTGTWTPPAGISKAEITVIDGGTGGSYGSDQPGAGGKTSVSIRTVSSSTTYTATIGAGGAGGSSGSPGGGTGGASSFSGSGFTTLTSTNGDLNVVGGELGDTLYSPTGAYGVAGTAPGQGGGYGGSGIPGYSGASGAVIIRY